MLRPIVVVREQNDLFSDNDTIPIHELTQLPTMPATRQSPLTHLLEARGAEFRSFGGGWHAVRCGTNEYEQRALQCLGLCDLSGLQKIGLKGPDAQTWLTSKGLDVPGKTFASCPLAAGGVIVRLGADEFFLEDAMTSAQLPALAARIDSHKGRLCRVERQEATLLLIGRRCTEALAQTCGIDFRESEPGRAIFTRVAGVSCGVLPETIDELPAYRLWLDPSFAVYLWETLAEICGSLEGGPIGAGCLYPELLA